jgi:hypothetical protein
VPSSTRDSTFTCRTPGTQCLSAESLDVAYLASKNALEYYCLRRIGRVGNAIYSEESEIKFGWEFVAWLTIKIAGVISLTKSFESGFDG